VIVGASIHMGKHERYVSDFVRKHRDVLERLPSAFFSVSLAAYDDREEAQGSIERFVQETDWHPAMIGLFGGALLYTQYGFIKRRLMKKIARDKGTLDTDTSHDYVYTDWESVKHFAEELLSGAELTSRVAGGRSQRTIFNNRRRPCERLRLDRGYEPPGSKLRGRHRDRSECMRHLGKTPPFLGPQGEVVSASIAEIAYRRLGGLDQWVMIRGESVANPPLILLHGGPGLSETGLFRHFNAPLEKSFTIVYWDQRGAGKSFDRNIPRSSLTVEQLISDLDELVDAVCTRLGKTRVAIFGHSWGSALGMLYAARFPEKVAAYVGSGQIGDWAAGEAGSYAFVLAETQRLGKHRAVKKLRAIGPPPHTAKSLWAQRMWLSRLEGRMAPRAMWKVGRALLASEESSISDLPSTMRGFRFSLGAMWAEVSRLNLIELVPAVQMPVFLFLGRKDHWVPAEVSEAYLDALTAPSKRLVWFEESGHEPFVDEPAKFNAAMAELVRSVLASDRPEGAA
jgi:pimeloyl-ACP methyl ester carboxylesterase/menaquinone-dependent protoporphyrinogen IX oxidase